ncbi:MAG: GNAT family N-acetyltransferase [Desulfobacterales bacterium]
MLVSFYQFLTGMNESGVHVISSQLTEHLHYPGCRPDENIFLALANRKIIGICELAPEAAIGRVLLNIIVHPEYRRNGVGSELLTKALLRGREIGLYVTHANISESNVAGKSFLEAHGFKRIRQYSELHLNIRDRKIEAPDPHPFRLKSLKKGQEYLLTMMQNEFFKGSWGFNPNSVEKVRYEILTCGGTHNDILVTFDGNRPVGYCWTKTDVQRAKKGRIHMIGVNPAYRGGGLGKATLQAGLCRLKHQGVHAVELTTDSSNTPAVRLYRSMGFKVRDTLPWYERKR